MLCAKDNNSRIPMKTHSSSPSQIFRISALLPLGVAIAAALLTPPLHAGAIDSLVITENSSTSLTAILNGTTSLSVTPHGTDNWSIALNGVGGNAAFWTEPDNANFINFVSFSPNFPNQLTVQSDFPHSGGGLPDGTPVGNAFTLNGGLLSVTFFDKGDVAAAPDTGSTFGLLALALAALVGATPRRALRLA